jgi:hypothetical protein
MLKEKRMSGKDTIKVGSRIKDQGTKMKDEFPGGGPVNDKIFRKINFRKIGDCQTIMRTDAPYHELILFGSQKKSYVLSYVIGVRALNA